MKKRIRNIVTSSFLAFVMAVTPICVAGTETVQAAATNTSQGSNVNAQNYANWPSTRKSYLSECKDGRLMRVQGVESRGTLIEYYKDGEEGFQLDGESKVLDCELPKFGGFYETDNNYFLLTGQNNPSKSPNVEVYRITKYDKDWNRLDAAELRNCNTLRPFAFGSARMAHSGNYLVIRTCHDMYNGHQSNMMIQLDMNTMNVTVGGDGYVSHSLNQFVKVDNDYMIAIDQGDYYPRGILLRKYNNKVSSGKSNKGSTSKIVFTIPQPLSVYTGTSVGGLEISNSSYLVAGSSCMRNDNTSPGKQPRDIFVSATTKDNMTPKVNWLTDYTKAADTANTPHLVEIDKDNYLVLWKSGNNKVCYKSINGYGESTTPSAISTAPTASAIDAKLVEESTTATAGTICEMEGSLSDVVPIVVNDEIVWYTWNQKVINFYRINKNNLFENHKDSITNEGITYPPSAVSSVQPDDDDNDQGEIDSYVENSISGGGTSVDYSSGSGTSAPSTAPSTEPSAAPSTIPSAIPSAVPGNTTAPVTSAIPSPVTTVTPVTTETPAASEEPVAFDSQKKPALKTSVKKGSNSVNLNWSKIDGADGYIIYKYNKANAKYEKVKTISNPEKINCSIKMSYATSYSFRIRAFKTSEDDSKVYGKYSSVIKVTTAPAKVNGLKVKRAGNSKASLSWKKVNKASGYQIFSSKKKNGKYTLVKTLKKGSVLSTTVKQKGKKTYYYKVRAYVTNADKKRVYGNFGKSLSSKS